MVEVESANIYSRIMSGFYVFCCVCVCVCVRAHAGFIVYSRGASKYRMYVSMMVVIKTHVHILGHL